MERLAQELDDAFSFCLISTTKQVNHDDIAGKYTLSESLWSALRVEDVDGRAGKGDEIRIFLNEGTEELVCFATSFDHDVVVSHLLEKLVTDKTVAAS